MRASEGCDGRRLATRLSASGARRLRTSEGMGLGWARLGWAGHALFREPDRFVTASVPNWSFWAWLGCPRTRATPDRPKDPSLHFTLGAGQKLVRSGDPSEYSQPCVRVKAGWLVGFCLILASRKDMTASGLSPLSGLGQTHTHVKYGSKSS